VRRAACEEAGRLPGGEGPPGRPHEVDPPRLGAPVDDDLDHVAVAQLPDRPSREGLGADVADARARRHAGEPGVGQHRHLLSPGQELQGGGNLVGLLHARSSRPEPGHDDDVAGPHRRLGEALDRRHRRRLGGEDARRSAVPVDLVLHNRGIDRRRLDDRPPRGEVAHREDGGPREPATPRGVRVHDDLVGVDAVRFPEPLLHPPAPRARLPPVQAAVERLPGGGQHVAVNEPHPSQVEKHLRHPPRKEDANGRVVAGPVGQGVDEPGRRAAGPLPVGHRGRPQPRRVRDRGEMENQVRRSPESGVHE
jgi:hypothetical protein